MNILCLFLILHYPWLQVIHALDLDSHPLYVSYLVLTGIICSFLLLYYLSLRFIKQKSSQDWWQQTLQRRQQVTASLTRKEGKPRGFFSASPAAAPGDGHRMAAEHQEWEGRLRSSSAGRATNRASAFLSVCLTDGFIGDKRLKSSPHSETPRAMGHWFKKDPSHFVIADV